MPFVSSVRGTFSSQSKNRGVSVGDAIRELLRQDPNSPGLPTGGTIATIAGNRYHAFTTVGSANFVTAFPLTVDVLLVGGGGAGGTSYGDNDTGKGGGGAGGVVYRGSYSISASTYPIVVGAGGAGIGGRNNTVPPAANIGQNTTAFSVQANGGGGGGSSDNHNAPTQGGSGGGGGARNGNTSWNNGVGSNQGSYSGWTSYGGSGGNTQNGNYGGGGGGGAGGNGRDSTGGSNDSTGGNGGFGVDFSAVFGTSYGENGWFGGGGGGGSYATGSVKPQSIGGGGTGSTNTGGGGNGLSAREWTQGGQYLDTRFNALPNTGGGGGGSSEDQGLRADGPSKNGSGGSGIVLIKYSLV